MCYARYGPKTREQKPEEKVREQTEVDLLLDALYSKESELKSIRDRSMRLTTALTLKNIVPAWRLLEKVLEFQIENVKHNDFLPDLEILLNSPNGDLRDLGATYAAKIHPNTYGSTYDFQLWNQILYYISDLWEINPETGKRRSDAPFPRGIHDEYPNAQFWAVVAAIEHNCLPWGEEALARDVLNKYAESKPDIVEVCSRKLGELKEDRHLILNYLKDEDGHHRICT